MKKYEATPAGSAPPSEPGPVVLAALGNDDADQLVTALALQAARLWPGTALHLVHVVDVLPVAQAAVACPADEWSYPGLEEIRRTGSEYVDRFVFSTGEALGRPVTGHLRFGGAASEIAHLANELRASLLVVGSRDRGRLTRWLLGSVADALVREAPCSVLLARAPKYPAEARGGAGEVCPDCLQAEGASGGAILRCARHALAYGRTHGHVGAAERESS
ncbi:MAG TPA: universal stress protein [Polyangiaceae bacterium]|nr:universal stress protein [Polyangiaceae bacterium]